MTGRARGFSEDERAKGRGKGSLFPSSTKSCLKVFFPKNKCAHHAIKAIIGLKIVNPNIMLMGDL
jgi:hypothetical protein